MNCLSLSATASEVGIVTTVNSVLLGSFKIVWTCFIVIWIFSNLSKTLLIVDGALTALLFPVDENMLWKADTALVILLLNLIKFPVIEFTKLGNCKSLIVWPVGAVSITIRSKRISPSPIFELPYWMIFDKATTSSIPIYKQIRSWKVKILLIRDWSNIWIITTWRWISKNTC